MRNLEIRQIVLTGVMIALVAVFTLAIRVPFAPTRGYFNFSDVAVFFSGFAFGPWIGLIAGGVGAGLADVVGGYAMYAPLTFFAHGLEGLIAGYIGGRSQNVARMILAWALGAIVMLALYFLGETFVFRMGIGPASTEALTVNIPQVVAGGIVAIPLVLAVRRAYPPIIRWAQPQAG
ncbi:MAG: ECF transporter S component [Chloroflexota bacterium]|nr:ECF transporter S component [Chloroflexota bacterium]